VRFAALYIDVNTHARDRPATRPPVLQADAVLLIGAAHWLHVPVDKLHEDRYLPLHPHLATLIDDYRTAHVAPDNPLLLPRENGTALDRHTVTRLINKAGAAAGLPHIHPHQVAAVIDFRPPAPRPVAWEISRLGCDPRTILRDGDWLTGFCWPDSGLPRRESSAARR
jgi:hypothetical protein